MSGGNSSSFFPLEFKISWLTVNPEYLKALSKDEKGRDFDGYYTFPQIEFKAFDQKDHIKTFEIETEQELLALFMDCDRINI